MDRSELGRVPKRELSWECIKPEIMEVRGKDLSCKAEAYEKLGVRRRTLFAFHVYYNHARKSPEDFDYWSRLYVDQRFFGEIIRSVEANDFPALSLLLTEVKDRIDPSGGTAPSSLEDLFPAFLDVSDRYLDRLGDLILSDPAPFLP